MTGTSYGCGSRDLPHAADMERLVALKTFPSQDIPARELMKITLHDDKFFDGVHSKRPYYTLFLDKKKAQEAGK